MTQALLPHEQFHIRARLARQMGYAAVRSDSGSFWLWKDGQQISVSGWAREEDCWLDAPDPFTNAADNRALVAWLAADDARWLAFRKEILLCWAVLPDDVALSHGYYEKWFLTLPYETITLAAARALGIPEASE